MTQLVIVRPYDKMPYTVRVLVGQWGLEFGLYSARGILDFDDFFLFFPGILFGRGGWRLL